MKRLLFLAVVTLIAVCAWQGTAQAQGSLLTKSCNLLTAVTTTGNGPKCDTSQMSVLGIQVTTASASYQINFQASNDGTNFYPVSCYPQGSSTAATGLTTTFSSGAEVAAMWRCNVAGWASFRLNVSATDATAITAKGFAFSSPAGLGGLLY